MPAREREPVLLYAGQMKAGNPSNFVPPERPHARTADDRFTGRADSR